MEKEFVIYNGQRMVKGWPEKIEAAQLQPTMFIDGIKCNRIRYGNESKNWHADQKPCRDCGVLKGQFHVVNCDVEECPACGEQAITCSCDYDENFHEDPLN